MEVSDICCWAWTLGKLWDGLSLLGCPASHLLDSYTSLLPPLTPFSNSPSHQGSVQLMDVTLRCWYSSLDIPADLCFLQTYRYG